jgi:hypothetical protein
MREEVQARGSDWEFFRFRSQGVDRVLRARVLWVADAMAGIDFDADTLLSEAYQLVRFLKGGFSYGDLRDMPFDAYEKIVAMARKEADAG